MKVKNNITFFTTLTFCGALHIACGDDLLLQEDPIEPVCKNDAPIATYTLTQACNIGVNNATRIVTTTTDFSTGSVSVASIQDTAVEKDIALGSTDGIPYYHDGLIYVVHRFGVDRIDVFDAVDDFAFVGQFRVEAEDVASTNPHAIAFAEDNTAFVSLHGTGSIRVMDFSKAPENSLLGEVDMSYYADPDNNPDLSPYDLLRRYYVCFRTAARCKLYTSL